MRRCGDAVAMRPDEACGDLMQRCVGAVAMRADVSARWRGGGDASIATVYNAGYRSAASLKLGYELAKGVL